jgi:hypothetical protein
MKIKLYTIVSVSIVFFAACTNPSVSKSSIDATSTSSSSNSQNEENKSFVSATPGRQSFQPDDFRFNKSQAMIRGATKENLISNF